MAKIYTAKGLKIKDGTTDEVINSDGSDIAFGADGDVCLSEVIFAKKINDKWTCRYNSAEHCEFGEFGEFGPPGQSARATITGFSKILLMKTTPNYNVNCRLGVGYSILNVRNGKVYEFDINSQSYIENTNKRITNG